MRLRSDVWLMNHGQKALMHGPQMSVFSLHAHPEAGCAAPLQLAQFISIALVKPAGRASC